MNFSINQLEHIYKALKLYISLWNAVSGVPKTLHISDDEKEGLEKLCDKIKEEIKNQKLHS